MPKHYATLILEKTNKKIVLNDCLKAESLNKLKKELGEQNLEMTIFSIVWDLSHLFNSKYAPTDMQIRFFSEQFLEKYGYESLDDLILCLKNAAVGMYGNVNHTTIDPPQLFEWFKIHLNQKYEEKEKQLHHKKITITEQVSQNEINKAYCKMIREDLKANRPPKKTMNQIREESELKQWNFIEPYLEQLDKNYLSELLEKYLNKDGDYSEQITKLQTIIKNKNNE